MNIYNDCPTIENDSYIIRLLDKDDCDDLLRVYSDKNALPFFNSDNCDGDNFYYATEERMKEAVSFWKTAYDNGWFARLSIIDKESGSVIGTIELCLRASEEEFNNIGMLRVDVRSDYEKEECLYSITALIIPHLSSMLGCRAVLTKAPLYAVERIKAIQKIGFTKSENYLIGKTGYAYDGYWTINL